MNTIYGLVVDEQGRTHVQFGDADETPCAVVQRATSQAAKGETPECRTFALTFDIDKVVGALDIALHTCWRCNARARTVAAAAYNDRFPVERVTLVQ